MINTTTFSVSFSLGVTSQEALKPGYIDKCHGDIQRIRFRMSLRIISIACVSVVCCTGKLSAGSMSRLASIVFIQHRGSQTANQKLDIRVRET